MSEHTTHQKIFWCLSRVGVFQQTAVHKLFRLLREPPLRRQPWCGFVHDMLQQLQDAHRHPAALQTDTLALAFLLLVCLYRRPLGREGSTGRERALEVREIRIVIRVREGEAAQSELDK